MAEIRFIVTLPSPADFPINKARALDRSLRTSLQTEVGPMLVSAMQARVANWSKKPAFRASVRSRLAGKGYILYVQPVGPHRKIWMWVSLGTRVHTIRPRRAARLRFQKHKPKTLPGNRYGRVGKYYGPTITATRVRQGIKARRFEDHIVEELEDKIVRTISKAGLKEF